MSSSTRPTTAQRGAAHAQRSALQLARELRALAGASQQDAGTVLRIDGQSLRMLTQQLGQRAAAVAVQLASLRLPCPPASAARLEAATTAALGAAAALRILAGAIAARPVVELHAEDLHATFDGLAAALFDAADAAAETAHSPGVEVADEAARLAQSRSLNPGDQA